MSKVISKEKQKFPCIQFRWVKGDGSDFCRDWECHYEIVIPLREFDIRREDKDGNIVRENLVIYNSVTYSGAKIPCIYENEYFFDTPYRDGAHSHWDNQYLNFPIYAIAPDGTVIEKGNED